MPVCFSDDHALSSLGDGESELSDLGGVSCVLPEASYLLGKVSPSRLLRPWLSGGLCAFPMGVTQAPSQAGLRTHGF